MGDVILLQCDAAIVAVTPSNPEKLKALSFSIWTQSSGANALPDRSASAD